MRFLSICFLLLLSCTCTAQALKNMDSYLGNSQISLAAKDFYGRNVKVSDDAATLSTIDSLQTHNDECRPFYLYLVSEMLMCSDGALSEALGMACKNFVERRPNELLEFLESTPKSPTYKRCWSTIIASELKIDCEGKEKVCYIESYRNAMARCTDAHLTTMGAFYTQIKIKCDL